MKLIEHVIVCYGHQLGYHHGAKFQILKNWKRWYSRPESSICVVTDRPDLFGDYPVRLIEINKDDTQRWTAGHQHHFGIKLMGLSRALETSASPKLILLDTDMYWSRDPITLLKQINQDSVVMYQDEGHIFGSRNASIQRFHEGLSDRTLNIRSYIYKLTSDSRMLGSAIIGVERSNGEWLTAAFDFFKAIEPYVAAHTVEQFALSEVARLRKLHVTFGKPLTKDWSSIGRKNYATPVLGEFFSKHGEVGFENHLKRINEVRIHRPLGTLLKQKWDRWQNK